MSGQARKPIAMLILMVWLIAYIVGVASLSGVLAETPRWAQLIFYMIAGVAWVLPLKFLFNWMNSPGRNS